MLASLLLLSASTMAFGLLGLLAFGSRWRRAGLLRCAGYALVVGSLAGLTAVLMLGREVGELALGAGLALISATVVYLVKPDWNPPAQALFGTLALTCGLFVAYAASFAFSQTLPALAYPANAILISFEIFALALLLIATHETLDTAARVRWHRRTAAREIDGFTPFVSIHVPTHNEPPELVIETLTALRSLDYPAYEVIVLDNNTDDPGLWQPVARFCEEAGLRFVHLEDWPGYKAGALNHGLEICDPRTEVIAVVDADFVVEPDFLRRSVGSFANPRVGIVQTAQRFRADGESSYLRRLGLTFQTFDEISMPSRNERNAIIFAGTMGLLRREALVAAGGWGEWCVTEDAELSVRMLARGYDAVYIEEAFGSGVMPLTFAGLKRQRFRWCLGGIQLLRAHWRLLLRGRGTAPDGAELKLTPGQRYDYLAASLQWFMPLAAIGFAFLLLISVVTHALGNELALRPLAGPLLAVPLALLIIGVVRALWGLRSRLDVTWGDSVAVMAIFLALSWAVALACVRGFSGNSTAFLRTPKFGERESLLQTIKAARAETALAVALTAAAAVSALTWPAPDAFFIASLCGWSAIIFWCAPATAIAASRMKLGSEALRSRRRLESGRVRGRAGRRRAGYASATVATVALAALIVPGLASSPGGSVGDAFGDFGDEQTVPDRGGRAQESLAADLGRTAGSAPASGRAEQRAGRPGVSGSGSSTGSNDARQAGSGSSTNTPPATSPPASDPAPSEPPASQPPSGSQPGSEPPSSQPVDTPTGPPADPSDSRPVTPPSPPDSPGSAPDRPSRP